MGGSTRHARKRIADPVAAFGCDPSYPDLCVPSYPPDLDCASIYDFDLSHITVLPPDPHGFDGNQDGVGCEGG